MKNRFRKRRLIATFVLFILLILTIIQNTPKEQVADIDQTVKVSNIETELATNVLKKLSIKGRAPKTDYSRDKFGGSWNSIGNCDMRNIILNRDLENVVVDENCNIVSGTLNDPYTGKSIVFKRGSDTSGKVQIDHVVALSDAWQKGAQLLSIEQRTELANDPLELLAVDGEANLQKSGSDAATWLPPNKAFRCQYVARQIAVKQKYSLWITQAEFDAIIRILETCPQQTMPAK